ncbi:MAG: hypothetical protein LQ339_008467 [Xanthoria mediterranea]|nr:MAG: hypothetical protein LQ339_008467 [Xanthoria mediterranea]
MPPSKPIYDHDWLYSDFSNVHVATHRDWFTSYTPFDTELRMGPGPPVQIIGIGCVELPTESYSSSTGTPCQAILRLRNVLHVPQPSYNLIGGSTLDGYHYYLFHEGPVPTTGWIKSPSGTCVGFLDGFRWHDRLRLYGQSAEHTSLDPSCRLPFSARWPNTERAKWEAYLIDHAVDSHEVASADSSKQESTESPPASSDPAASSSPWRRRGKKAAAVLRVLLSGDGQRRLSPSVRKPKQGDWTAME